MGYTVALSLPDRRQRSLFALLLADAQIELITCEDASEIGQLLAFRPCDLCVLASAGPASDGEILAEIRRVSPRTKVLLLCAKDDLEQAVGLFREGLDDLLVLPIRPKTAVAAIQRLLGSERRATHGPETAPPPLSGPAASGGPRHLIAHSAAMSRCIRTLRDLREDIACILLRGESGSEFELLARAAEVAWGDGSGDLHVLPGPLVSEETLNPLLEAAFLSRRRVCYVPGVERLEAVQQETVVAFLRRLRGHPGAQGKLRIVFSATEVAGKEMDDLFVEELQFLVPTRIDLPPLRERPEDIAALARIVLADLTALFPSIKVRTFHPAALEWMQREPWYGNYEELVTRIHRSLQQCTTTQLMPRDFQCFFEWPREGSAEKETLPRLAQ